MYQEIGSCDEAVVELSKVLAVDPANTTAHLYIGLAYRDKDFHQEAQNHLERVIELGGERAAAYAGLASICLARRRFEEALKLARKSTRAKDTYVQGHLITGDVYQAMGDDEIALLKFEKVLSLDPQSREGHYRRAVSCRNLERWDDAIYELRRTLEIDPDFVPAHLELGELYERRGDSARALAEFESIIALSKDNPDLCRKIGRAYHAAGRLNIAARYFEHLLQLRPDEPAAKELLAAAYRDLGRFEESVNLYEEVIRTSPERAGAYQGLATTCGALGDTEKEVFFLRKAIKTDPRCIEALHSLGNSYVSRNCSEEAAFVFRKCIRVMPEDPRGYELLGRLEHGRGHLDTAIYQYQKAVSLGSRSAELFYNLGDVYRRKGRGLIFRNSLYREMARKCFLDAIDLDKGLRKAPERLRSHLYRLAEEERLLPAGRFVTSVTQRFWIRRRFSLFTDSLVITSFLLGFRARRSFPLSVISPDFTLSHRKISPVTLVGLAVLVLLLLAPGLGIVSQTFATAAGAVIVAAIAVAGVFASFPRYVFHDRYSHKMLFEYRPGSPDKEEAETFLKRLSRRLARQPRVTT
jgi:tetratricopeptide (TPR) repeat protein